MFRNVSVHLKPTVNYRVFFKTRWACPQEGDNRENREIKNNIKIKDFPDFCLIWEMGGPN